MRRELRRQKSAKRLRGCVRTRKRISQRQIPYGVAWSSSDESLDVNHSGAEPPCLGHRADAIFSRNLHELLRLRLLGAVSQLSLGDGPFNLRTAFGQALLESTMRVHWMRASAMRLAVAMKNPGCPSNRPVSRARHTCRRLLQVLMSVRSGRRLQLRSPPALHVSAPPAKSARLLGIWPSAATSAAWWLRSQAHCAAATRTGTGRNALGACSATPSTTSLGRTAFHERLPSKRILASRRSSE